MPKLKQHPDRQILNDEIHARPSLPIKAPTWITYLAFMIPADNRAQELLHLEKLFTLLGQTISDEQKQLWDKESHFIIKTASVKIKWERHGEFSGYTFYVSPPDDAINSAETTLIDDNTTALSSIPNQWLESLPGAIISSCHIQVLPSTITDGSSLLKTFKGLGKTLVASRIANGNAWVFTDFQMHNNFSRYILIDEGMGKLRLGRTVQRLLEIEVYRILALMGFPLAKSTSSDITRAEQELATLIEQRMQNASSSSKPIVKDDNLILNKLTRLAGEVEHLIAATSFRFSAGLAYFNLVEQRIHALKETSIAGFSSINGFMERRLNPAIATCNAVSQRQQALSERITRTTELLRTRVSVELERQNQKILEEMNRRAILQWRLQETVEGLSVVVITYYGAQLIYYLAKGIKASAIISLTISPEIITAISIPVLALIVFLFSQRIKKKLFAE